MKRMLLVSAGLAVVLAGLFFFVPVKPAGRMSPGTGVYIGQDLLLSNQHILVHAMTGQEFVLSAWLDIGALRAPIQEVVYLDRDLDLGIARLGSSLLNVVKVPTPCLSPRPLRQGEQLRVASAVRGELPLVPATLAVRDARPAMLLDPDSRMPPSSRYAAMSVVATLPASEAGRVGPGSSGAPVLNDKGELVGLVWTGQPLPDGSTEVLITPVSAWLTKLSSSNIAKDVLADVLAAQCGAGSKGQEGA